MTMAMTINRDLYHNIDFEYDHDHEMTKHHNVCKTP